MSLAYSGSEPQPALAWQFESSNVDSVTSLAPSSQVSPGPAQLQGSAALVTNAPTSNTAVSFPNSQTSYMDIGTNGPVNFNTATSNLFVESWVYFISKSFTAVISAGVSPSGGGTENWSLYLDGTSMNFYFFNTTGGLCQSSNTLSLNTGTWYHVAGSWDSTTQTLRCFVNGYLGTVTATCASPRNTANSKTLIGQFTDLGRTFNGYIRDLRVVQGGVVPVASFTPGAAPFSYASPGYVANMGTTVFTLLGQFVTYPTGKYGQGIQFNNQNTSLAGGQAGTAPSANSYVVYGTAAGLVSGPQLFYSNLCSISLWINPQWPNQAAIGTNRQYIFGFPSWIQYWMVMDNSVPGTPFYVATNTGGRINSSLPYTPYTWTHHCMTLSNVAVADGTRTMSYYTNGILQGTSVINTGVYADGRSFMCDGIVVGAGYYNGPGVGGTWMIADDLRIYNTALTPAQVASVYSSQGAPAPSLAMPLPQYAWSFDGTTTDYVSGVPIYTGFFSTPFTNTYTPGVYNQAVSLTNSNQGSTPDNVLNYANLTGLSVSNGITITFWAKLLNLPASGTTMLLCTNFPSSGGKFFYIGLTGSSALVFGGSFGGSLGYTATQGAWFFLALTINSAGTLLTYINNNSPVVNGTNLAGYGNLTGFSFGASYGGGPFYAVSCAVDDLRVYPAALTSTQVQSIYNQQGMPGRGVQQIVPNNDKTLAFYTPFENSLVDQISGSAATVVGTITYDPGRVGNYSANVYNPVAPASNNASWNYPSLLIPYTANYTIAFWFKQTNSQTYSIPFRLGGGANGTIYPTISGTSPNMGVGIAYLDNGTQISPTGTSTNPGFSINTWQHFVTVFGESTPAGIGAGRSLPIIQYLNGSVVYSGSFTNTNVYSTSGTIIQLCGPASSFCGDLDDFRMYNYPLSASQVSSLYATTSPYKIQLTGTPLFSQLSPAATSSAVGAFSLRAVNGTSAKAVAVQAHPVVQWPPVSMTSNTTVVSSQLYGNGTYVATASVPNSTIWYIFDNNISTYYEQATAFPYNISTGTYIGSNTTTISSVSVSGEWFQVQLPTSIILRSYTLVGRQDNFWWANRNPTTFWIAGSSDGTTWSNVHQQTNITPPQQGITINVPTTSNSLPYTYYRLVVNIIGNSNIGVNQRNLVNLASWNLYGDAPSYAPNASQDFYADRLGNLLTAPVVGQSLANWLGGATGYVTTWYDQSGAGNHASQATAANQPVIQRATKGAGYMCLYSGTQGLPFGAYDLLNNTNYTTCGVVRRTAIPNSNYYLCGNGGVNGTDQKFHSGYRNSTQLTLAQYNDDTNLTVPSFLTSSTEPTAYNYLMLGTGLTGRLYSYSAGTLYSTSGYYAGYLNQSTGASFSIGGGLGSFTGEIYELLIFKQSLYDLDTSGGLVTQIYQNQLSAYGT